MKTLLSLMLMITLPLGSFAHASEEDDNAFLETVIKKAVENTLKGEVVQITLEHLDEEIFNKFKPLENGYVIYQDIAALKNSTTDAEKTMNAAILAAQLYSSGSGNSVPYLQYANLIRSVLQYDKMDTERDKYFAAVQVGVAYLATICPFGYLLELAVIGNQMNDVYVRKNALPKIESMVGDYNKLGLEVAEKKLARARIEAHFLQTMLVSVSMHLEAAHAVGKQMKCKDEDFKTTGDIAECRSNAKRFLYLNKVALQTLETMLSANLEFITLKEMDKTLGLPDKSLEDTLENVTAVVKKLQTEDDNNEKTLRELAMSIDDRMILIKMKDQTGLLDCLKTTKETVTPLIARLKTGPSPSALETPFLKTEMIEAQTNFNGKCLNLKNVPAPTQRLLNTMTMQMSTWSHQF